MLAAAAAALALSACGGTGPEPAQEAPEPAAPADLGAVGDALGWECGDELVDVAGYTKRVCAIPDDLMEPGMTSNAVGLHAWSERAHVDTYQESYLGDGVLVVGDGWFADAPTERVAEAVRSALD